MTELRPNSSASGVLAQFHSDSESRFYLYGALWAILLAVASWLWFRGHTNSQEPPQLSPKVPFIGHLIGLIQHQGDYFVQLRARHSWPIFTLKIFSSRIYVITSPELTQAVFRNSRALSFDPISAQGAKQVLQMDDEAFNKLSASPGDHHSSYVEKTGKGMHVSMQAGASLLQMNSRALNRLAVFLDDIGTSEEQIDLYKWVRDHVTLASAEAIYGKENPIADDPSLIESLEDFETSIGILFLNILPSITARKGYSARLKFGRAFKSYYSRGLVKNASALIQGRYRDITSSGVTHDSIAEWEISIFMAATMNSVNGGFWMLGHVFSDPELALELRAEVSNIVTREVRDGVDTVCFDVSQLQNSCPLLCSTWQETLRADNGPISQRVVMEDTLLNGTYFLKKDSVVQIPSRTMHESPEVWGADAHIFNPRRFLKSNIDAMSREQKKLQKQGYIPFGGGAVLCPGRHFATTETVGIVATILLGYEIRMADESEQLKVPKGKKQEIGVAVKIPECGLNVLIKRKAEFEGVKWTYNVGGDVGESDMVF